MILVRFVSSYHFLNRSRVLGVISFNLKNIKESQQGLFLALDFLMLALVIVNLTWLVFDTLFSSQYFQDGLIWLAPGFSLFYKANVHPNFVAYDLIFVTIFLSELLLRWAVAIYQKTYHKWFFYPFVHWYDVLGCIPVGSFRWLRLLRVISILYRLQKHNIIDLSKSFPYRFVKKYADIIVEEVSDRVVVNVLNGVQDEVRSGSPVVSRVLSEVLVPHKQVIVEWLVERLNGISTVVYPTKRRELEEYIDRVVSEAIAQDAKVAALEKIPVVGAALTDVIENTVGDIVFNVIDRLVADLGHQDTDRLITELFDGVLDSFMEPSDTLNAASKSILLSAIDVVKEEVKVQQWKVNEQDL